MKIFGKKRRSTPTTPPTTPQVKIENVPSYFDEQSGNTSSKAADKKQTGRNKKKVELVTEIDQLLKLEPSELNAKQRRLLKRHRDRESPEDNGANDEKKSPLEETAEEKTEETTAVSEEEHEEEEEESIDDASTKNIAVKKEIVVTSTNESTESKPSEEEPTSLEGLNSKERRKLLRKWKREGKDITLLENSIAPQSTDNNQTEATDKKRQLDADTDTPTPKRKRRKKDVDWSTLQPEEKKRREHQRKMQEEAAKRRASGEGTNSGHKHPLNSERRRANKRKPGKARMIAEMKKQAKSDWDAKSQSAWGYQMRSR